MQATVVDGDEDDMPKMEELTARDRRGMWAGLLSGVLGVAPVSLDHWLELLLLALSLVVVMELHKLFTRRRALRAKTYPAS
jgi:hypothetical protein